MIMTAKEIIMDGYYTEAVELMDDEIREDLARTITPCDELTFLTEYMKRHAEKYGEEFTV